jgi:hypothetical protein
MDNFIIHRFKGIEKGHGFLAFECTKFDNFTYMIYDHCKQSSNVHQLMVMIFVHLFVVFVYDEPKSCDWVLIEDLFLELKQHWLLRF